MKRYIIKTVCPGIICIVSLLTSCTPKDVTYFQDVRTETIDFNAAERMIRLEPQDKVTIVVKSKDPELSNLFNLGVYTTRIGDIQTGTGSVGQHVLNYNGTTQTISTYTVSPKGTIDFPVLGVLNVEGMNRFELAGFIKGELIGRHLVMDPVVTVEFVNTGVNVMGEVNRPGRYDVNRDHLTVLDALGLAGDLRIDGKRTDVIVMRKVGDKMQTYRIDLTNAKQMMQSEGYYLKQNDIVYVSPNNVRKRQTTVNGNTALQASFWVSVASLLTSVAVLIFK